MLSLTSSNCQKFPPKIFLEPTPLSTSLEYAPSSSPPRSLHAVIESSPEPPRRRFRPRSSPFMCRHLPRPEPVTPSTTQASSPSLRCHSQACNTVVLPELMTMCTPRRSRAHDAINPCRPWAHNAAVLPEPVMSSSLRCPRACDTIKPMSSLSPQRCRPPQACNATLYIFLCHFGPTNPDFNMLHCHIALICYIILFCYILIYMNATTLLNDKSGLSETSLATWTNIIILLRFQHRTT
jgi:hypothetical protein